MKNILLFLTLLSLLSCTTSIEENLTLDPEDYFLTFDINDQVYKPELQKNYAVNANQNLAPKLIFVDAYKSTHKYPFFSHQTTLEDSVDIIGAIHFEAESDFGFEDRIIDFEIILRESLSNLEELSDSTFTYKSNRMLYEQLKAHDFGHKDFSFGEYLAAIFITVPDQNMNHGNIFFHNFTSNGFIFENEDLELTEITFNNRTEQILVKGNFEVQLKQLSCGFYSTHQISNAEFSILIQ